MKLSHWAKSKGIGYKTAYRLVSSNRFPGRVERLPTGTILVFEDDLNQNIGVAIYARVSSVDRKKDAERQMERLRSFCLARGWQIVKEVIEIGSGINGKQKKLLSLLGDTTVRIIVVEHRDRLGRFGAEMVEATFKASERNLFILNESECKDDIVQDFVDIVTSMCARIYGKSSAKNRAQRAIEAASE